MNEISSDTIFFGYGRITDYLINYFLDRGKSVICVTNQPKPKSKRANINFLSRKDLNENRVVSDLAVFSWRDLTSLNDETYEWLSYSLVGIQKSFFLSSASVYMSSEKLLNENSSNLSSNHSLNAKFLLERKLTQIFAAKETSHVNLRIGNVYGPNLRYGFISSLLDSLNHNIPADIYIGKTIKRDYVSVHDLSLAIDRLTKNETNMKELNISTGIGTDIEGVLQAFEELGRKIVLRNYINAPDDIKTQVVLDCGLLQSLIQWEPTLLKIGISKILSGSSL